MKLPQAIIVVAYLLRLGCHLANDNRPRAGRISFFETLVSTLVLFSILYWGGFFD